MNEADYERVLQQMEVLEDENVKLKKYIAITQRRSKKDLELKTKTLDKSEKELSDTQKLLETVTEKHAEERSTNGFLREDLTKSKVLATTLQTRLEALSNELEESRNSESNWQDLDKRNLRLGQEISKCLKSCTA